MVGSLCACVAECILWTSSNNGLFAVWFCSFVIALCVVKVTDVTIFRGVHMFTFLVRDVVRKL